MTDSAALSAEVISVLWYSSQRINFMHLNHENNCSFLQGLSEEKRVYSWLAVNVLTCLMFFREQSFFSNVHQSLAIINTFLLILINCKQKLHLFLPSIFRLELPFILRRSTVFQALHHVRSKYPLLSFSTLCFDLLSLSTNDRIQQFRVSRFAVCKK